MLYLCIGLIGNKMGKILKVRNVNDYGRYLGCADQHPLVSVIDYDEVSPIRHSLNNYSVYGLFLRDDADVDLDYGCGKYDYNKGTLLCVAPGQIGGKEDNGERVAITGWALLFHPDLLHGFPLEKRIKEYSFFDYRVNEALHMIDEEHDILVSLMRQMREELDKNSDELQNAILVGYIELTLNFCQRFYNRQFVTRKVENSDILVRFDRLSACLPCSIAPTSSVCRPIILAMSSRKPPATRRATTSASSSSSLPRTAWRQGKPSPKCPTASASSIPSISAGCSRNRRALRRQSMSERCDCDVLGHL